MNLINEKEIFGHNIQILINQRNWSIQHAAKEIKYDRNKLSKILIGQQNFKLTTAIKFARFFNVSVFLLFDRVFENSQYRDHFPFIESDYMFVFRKNFKNTQLKQASIHPLDSAIVSHIISGHRNDITINTLHRFSQDSEIPLSELLKTETDKHTQQLLRTNN